MKGGQLCFHQLQIKHWDAALNGHDVEFPLFLGHWVLLAWTVDGGGVSVWLLGGGSLNSLFFGHYVAI